MIENVYIIKVFIMRKIIYITLISLTFILLLFIVFGVLLFLGKIQDYKYLKINNINKENIVNLLKEQEEDMFILENNISLNTCYKNLERIEVVYRFPDGEDYIIYCQDNKISFSLDNGNYNLPKYISENGHTGFRFN